jgi:hypothetical protein
MLNDVARIRLWLVVVPLVAAGTESAASLVDRFAPKSYVTAELFSRSNGSHHLLPLAAAVGAALVLYALRSIATDAPATPRLPPWMFATFSSRSASSTAIGARGAPRSSVQPDELRRRRVGLSALP